MTIDDRGAGPWQYIWGFSLMSLGVILLLYTMDVIHWTPRTLQFWFWPTVFILIGFGQLAERPNARSAGIYWIGVGVLLLVFRTVWPGVQAWRFVAAATMIWCGIHLLLKRSIRRDRSIEI